MAGCSVPKHLTMTEDVLVAALIVIRLVFFFFFFYTFS